jgi:putative ABC transport system permease protein
MLATVLTSACVALGVALVVLVVTARTSARRQFDDAARGYDVILGGAKTSALSTVLSTVFFVDQPNDVIPIEAFDAVRRDPRVQFAVPYAVGDVFRGFRVVGTTPDLFDALTDASGKPLRERIQGRSISAGEEFEAVVGGIAAAETGLGIGGTFQVTHGLEDGGHQHEDVWDVVGVLAPTGTPLDRAIFITLGSFFHVKGHEGPSGGEGTPWAVSAVVVRLKSPALRLQFASDMNRRTDLQAALPAREITRLFAIVADVDLLFRGVALLVIVVSGVSILVGLYNSIQGRRREIAILRALGARPGHVFSVVVLEAVAMCAIGGAAGVALGHAALAGAAPALLDRFGIRISAAPTALDAWLVAGSVAMGLLAGALPAWRAFRVPVAKHLHPVD